MSDKHILKMVFALLFKTTKQHTEFMGYETGKLKCGIYGGHLKYVVIHRKKNKVK